MTEYIHALLFLPIIAMGFGLWQNGCICLVCQSCTILFTDFPTVFVPDELNIEYEVVSGDWVFAGFSGSGARAVGGTDVELRIIKHFMRDSGLATLNYKFTAYGQKVRITAAGVSVEVHAISSAANTGTSITVTTSSGTQTKTANGVVLSHLQETLVCFSRGRTYVKSQARVFWLDHDPAGGAEVRVGGLRNGSDFFITRLHMENHRLSRVECKACQECGGCEYDTQPTVVTLDMSGWAGGTDPGQCSVTVCNFWNDNIFVLPWIGFCGYAVSFSPAVCGETGMSFGFPEDNYAGNTPSVDEREWDLLLGSQVSGAISKRDQNVPRDCSQGVTLDFPHCSEPPGTHLCRWGSGFGFCDIAGGSVVVTKS